MEYDVFLHGNGLLHANKLLRTRAASEGPLKGILGYTDEDVVSNDFVGDSRWILLHTNSDYLCSKKQK